MSKFTLTLAAVALCGSMAIAQETVEVTSVTPAAGNVEFVASAMLLFPEAPTLNQECTEPAQLLHNSSAISQLYTYNTAFLQFYGEGQPDNSVMMKFLNRPMKENGEYEVVVPEGFFTFADGTKVNAAYTVKYTVGAAGEGIYSPAGGYYDAVPNIITLTIPGVVEIIDNHQPTHAVDNTGNMALFTPGDETIRIGDDVVIEGNTLTWKFAEEPFTYGGTYRMYVFAGALTLVMEDGRQILNPEYIVEYHKLVIPFPELDILEGTTDNEVYEIGDITFSYPEGTTFGIFLRNPSLYKVNEKGTRGDKVLSWNIDSPANISGKNSAKMFNPFDAPCTEPGDYFIVIGKSSFSVKGLFEDESLLGNEDLVPGPDGKLTLWNGIEYVYRLRIVPSPAEVTGKEGLAASEISSFPIYFPNAKSIKLADTPVEEAMSIRDRFWREQKGYELTLEIVNGGESAEGPAMLTDVPVCMAVCKINPPLTATKATEYDIHIPAGYFLCDNVESRQLIQHVTIDPKLTGILTPDVEEGEPATVTVVTPAGVTILKDAPATELFNIPAGLYIINGRATMLR